MDVQYTVAQLKQSIDTMADEVKLQDLIQQLLRELRVHSASPAPTPAPAAGFPSR